MAYRVEWSSRALEDLEAIAEYIAVDSTAYAAAVVRTILNTTRIVSRFPSAGRIVPEFNNETFASGLPIVIASSIGSDVPSLPLSLLFMPSDYSTASDPKSLSEKEKYGAS